MKVVCTSQNLKSAVSTAERFTGRHITLPILSHFLLKTEDKKISLIATNLETGIEYTIPGKIHKTGLLTVPAKPFSQLLQSLQDDNITLEAKHHQLIIRTPSTEITLLGLNPNEFPNLPTFKAEHSFRVSPGDFISALQQVLPAAATSEFKPEISGVFLAANSGNLILAATDSFRLAERTLAQAKGIQKGLECIIPARTLQELTRTIAAESQSDISVSAGEHQILFEWEGVRMLSRLIDGAYPPYKNIIPKSYESTLTVNRGDFLKKIRVASVFSSRLNDINIRFSPTELEITTTNAETGSTSARLNIKGRGAAGSSVFNYRYLLDGLEAAGGENVAIHLNGVSGPALIQNPADPQFLYLLMPIRSV